MKKFAAFRWLVYLVTLPLMLVHEIAIAIRTGFDLWCAIVQQQEAGWRRRSRERLTGEKLRARGEQLRREIAGVEPHGIVKPGWYCSREKGHAGPCAAWPVSHDAMASIRSPRGPFAATCDVQ